MTGNPINIIPVDQREAARRALDAAFGKVAVDDIAPVVGGVSGALVFRVRISGGQYVLRIEGSPGPLRNPYQYKSMRIAAEACIAPALHFVDDEAGVTVMDYVATQPLSKYPGGPIALAKSLGALIARVQATPSFPYFVEYPQIVARLWAHVCRTGLFADHVLDKHSEHLAEICEAYSWSPDDAVSSHNDLLPRNLLFDGRRLWLIDWESAYRNDPLVDVAVALDNFAPTPELEIALSEAWFGRKLDRILFDRLAHIRSLTRLYYAGVLLSASAASHWLEADDDLTALSPAQFEAAVRAGHLKPDTAQTTHVLGKMYLASFLTHAPAPGLPPAFSHFQI